MGQNHWVEHLNLCILIHMILRGWISEEQPNHTSCTYLEMLPCNFDHITKLSGWITMVNELDIQSQGKLKDVRCQWDHPSEGQVSTLYLAVSLVSPGAMVDGWVLV
jgi:hypothetical protein